MSDIVVYVAGPLSNGDKADEDGMERNVSLALSVGDYLLRQGFYPLVPHLTYYWHKANPERTYEKWLELGLALLSKCDAVLRMNGTSRGADIEIKYANKLGIPVFTSVDSMIRWRDMK